MPIIANAPIEIADREALAFEIADVINDAMTGDEKVGPLDVAHQILMAVDASSVYLAAPKRSTLPRRPGVMFHADAMIAQDEPDDAESSRRSS